MVFGSWETDSAGFMEVDEAESQKRLMEHGSWKLLMEQGSWALLVVQSEMEEQWIKAGRVMG